MYLVLRLAVLAIVCSLGGDTGNGADDARAEPLKIPFDAATAKDQQQRWAKQITAEPVRANSIGMKLALIPPGEFLMGSASDEKGHKGDETQHRVRITKPFYVGIYTVTQADFTRVMGKNPSYYSKTGAGSNDVTGLDTAQFPVEQVSWSDALEFCKQLSKLDGKTYRLPTEAEWEYACRAGTTTSFYTGEGARALSEAGWYGYLSTQGDSKPRTNRVGQKKPNAFGLYDMSGNVEEWCQDWYGQDYYANSPADDPQGPATGSYHLLRGGAWFDAPVNCRSAARDYYAPRLRTDYRSVGFRIVCSP